MRKLLMIALNTVALLGMSLPTFFFATLLKLVFSVKLGWFDLVGRHRRFRLRYRYGSGPEGRLRRYRPQP